MTPDLSKRILDRVDQVGAAVSGRPFGQPALVADAMEPVCAVSTKGFDQAQRSGR